MSGSKVKFTTLILEGFQTIAEKTEIPLEGLVLLYGPNSSGKSAVKDGLELARKALFAGDGGLLGGSPSWEVLRNWRRVGAGRSQQNYVDSLVIGVEAVISDEDVQNGSPPREPDIVRMELKYRNLLILPLEDVEYLTDLRIEVGGEWLVDYTALQAYRINLNNDVVVAAASELLKRKDGDYEGYALKDGCLTIKEPEELDPDDLDAELAQLNDPDPDLLFQFAEKYQRCALGLTSNGQFDSALYVTLMEMEEFKSPQFFTDEDVWNVVKTCNDWLDDIPTRNTDLLCVPDSRSIPQRKDLSFNFYRGEDLKHFMEDGFGVQNRGGGPYFYDGEDGNPTYRNLARSCLQKLEGRESEILAQTNEYLSDYLFLDRGYQVDFDWAVAIGSEALHDGEMRADFEKLFDYDSPIPNIFFLTMHLVDSNGVKLDFTDVGSGLGYVLPVLITLTSQTAEGYVDETHRTTLPDILIQQPELHLHPALQGALGDVFLHGCSPESRIMIETHSEHLLLRILRRMKEFSKGNQNKDKEVKATVLYFESLADGTTKVRNLRLSEDGEFLDKWPNGFFEERDRDLFYE